MNTNLHTYVKVYKNLIPDEICDQTVLNLQKANWTSELFYETAKNIFVPPKESLDITYDTLPSTDEIMGFVWKSLENYILKDFGFSWNNGWAGFSKIKYNRYSTTHGMDLHCDHIHSLFDGQRKGIPILSVVCLLNSDFEGGKFTIFEDRIIPLNKGDILVFPSNFLFPHKVTNITKGTRYSAVCWSW